MVRTYEPAAQLYAGRALLYPLDTKCAFLQSLQALKSEKVMEAEVQDLRAKLDTAAEALRKAEERALAGQFALEVMHEIRNPLEAVGYLMHLASQQDDQGGAREHLRQADEQMVNVHQITAQTLGFARIAADTTGSGSHRIDGGGVAHSPSTHYRAENPSGARFF